MLADPYEQIYEKLVALLKAEPTFYDATGANRALVWPGNFTEFSATSNQAIHPEKKTVNVGDYPLAVLVEDGGQGGGYLSDPKISFAVAASHALPTCGWRSASQVTWRLTLIGPDARMRPVSNLRWAAEWAIKQGGNKLGFTGAMGRSIKGWDWGWQCPPLGTMTTTTAAPQWQASQRVIHCRITVSFDFAGADLVA